MIIELNKLQLENFKGIKSLEVEFAHTTNIYGRNKAGKTTLFDAFLWVLFGKDSQGVSDFGIKTLDESGNVIPQIDHTVIATITVDGTEIVFKRTYREKWTRRRGAEETELTGHETLFYVNDVPLQANEYKAKISSIISEDLFKLVTSTTAFSMLPWQKRREVLVSMAGEISQDDIIKGLTKSQAKDITAILQSGKPMAEYRKEIAMRKKKLSDDLKTIPSRIDEVKRGMPEPANYEQVKKDIYAKQVAILEIETAITDKVSAYEEQAKIIQGKRSEINKLHTKLQAIEFDAKTLQQKDYNARIYRINELKQTGKNAVQTLKNLQADANNLLDRKAVTEQNIATLRQQWEEVNRGELVFKDGEFICPACKRELDPTTIVTRKEIMMAEFEADKVTRLNKIKEDGKRMAALLPEYDTEKAECDRRIKEVTEQIDTLAKEVRELEALQTGQGEVVLPAEHAEIKKQIDTFELSVLGTPSIDIDGLKQQKGTLSMELDALKRTLAWEEQIKKADARVKELMKEEKSLAQQIADMERQEFAMTAFEQVNMNMVESRVNDKFSGVKFRLFNTLINGGTEMCCETLVGGVPYSDCNSAGKIQAGIEIIGVLSDHYNVYAPCFSDNAETVNTMPKINSQMICLYVSLDDKLTIR